MRVVACQAKSKDVSCGEASTKMTRPVEAYHETGRAIASELPSATGGDQLVIAKQWLQARHRGHRGISTETTRPCREIGRHAKSSPASKLTEKRNGDMTRNLGNKPRSPSEMTGSSSRHRRQNLLAGLRRRRGLSALRQRRHRGQMPSVAASK